ncbi:MAG TPA: hypothetical protein VIA62_09255 [Thermoanaerobaculia bacterium]|jgi:hypothetical protein|nr:hypothetical protein [Thermoanaerobaculia bacterium]
MHRKRFAAALFLAGALAVPAMGQPPLPDVKPEFVVNTFTAGNQTLPAVAASPDGTLWITWFEAGQPPFGIKARRFAPSGSPLGPELWVHTGLDPATVFTASPGPRIGATADGGFVVVWADSPDVLARRFDRNGAPLSSELRVDPSLSFASISFPDVAVAPDGSFAVAWVRSDVLGDAVLARRFDPQGQPLGPAWTVASEPPRMLIYVRLAGAADGGFLTVWQDVQAGGIFARRYDGPSGAWSAAARVDGPLSIFDSVPAAALARDGSATVVWIAGTAVLGRRLSPVGMPAGPEVRIGEDPIFFSPPALAADADGNVFVVWGDPTLRLHGRLLRSDLTPAGPAFPVADPAFPATAPSVAATAAGGFAVAWSSGYDFSAPFEVLPPPPIPGRDGSFLGVAARLFGPARCAAGSEVLCLGPNGRFEARVAWKNPFNGDTGTGRTLPLTADTGAFWFFGDQNLELMVKVLDGTAVNGHFWVYAGALSNVEYTLTVTDTLTGAVRSYHNPPFQFASRADVVAFPAAASGADTAPELVPVDPPLLLSITGHFTASVQFTDPRTGTAQQAKAVPLTANTGAFWFFDFANLELMVKVLDGRAVNGKFWVFYGALSDVDYTLTVTNTDTGAMKIYHNPRGTLASRADTQAF